MMYRDLLVRLTTLILVWLVVFIVVYGGLYLIYGDQWKADREANAFERQIQVCLDAESDLTREECVLFASRGNR